MFGGDVAGDNFEVGELFLEHLNAVDDPYALSVRGIDHDEVDTGIHEGFGSFVRLAKGADSGSATEATFVVFGGVGVSLYFLNIFDGDEALEESAFIDDREFFDPMRCQEGLCLVESGSRAGGDQVYGGHPLGDGAIKICLESNISVCEDADKFAVVIGDWHPANMKMLHQVNGLLEHFVGGELDWIRNNSVL